MPGFDRNGPEGRGPLTGRGLGPCGRGLGSGRGSGRGFGRGPGRGFGRAFGRGMGRGFRRAYAYDYNYAPDVSVAPALTREQEKTILEDEIKFLEQGLDAIKKKLKELEK